MVQVQPDKMRSDDHDLLITLNTKVDGLVTDVRDLKDGVYSRLQDHERRINRLEHDHVAIGGVETAYEQLKENTDFIKNFQRSWRLVAGFLGLLGSVLGLILQALLSYLGVI